MKKSNDFQTLSIILPVIDEKISIDKTVKILIRENKKNINKIYFILHKKKTKSYSSYICRKFYYSNKRLFSILYQNKLFLGGAMQDAFEKINTSHCLMMSSDLETNPNTVKYMINYSKKNPKKIITASRWVGNVNFKGYGYLKILANFFFQKIFSKLYNLNCTDLTFGFRLFPTYIVKNIKWEMLNHSFLFETIIKPAKLGVEVLEVSSNWTKRIEGKTNNIFVNYFWYIYIGLKVFFMKKETIKKK